MINNNVRRDLTLIVKPTHKCNLNCPYCYDKINRTWSEDMSLDTVEQTIKLFNGRVREWIWHGGEPLLMGADWLRQASSIIRQYDPEVRIEIQTNGTLINEDVIRFFKEFNMRPGLSFDGILNEYTRKDLGKLLFVWRLLEKSGIGFGVIQVITPERVDHIIEEYEYFKRLGVDVQMNFEFTAHGNEASANVEGEKMGNGILKFFDYWIRDRDNPKPSILLENWIGRTIGYGMTFCENTGCAGRWFGIHPDGTLMPCGRDWDETLFFGNVHDYTDADEVYRNENFKKYALAQLNRYQECGDCPFFSECKSGCAGKAWGNGDINKPATDVCLATRIIFAGIFNRLKELDSEIEEHPENFNPLFIAFLQRAGYRGWNFIKTIESTKDTTAVPVT